MLKNVVLPAPLGPMIETIALSGTAKVTSSTATRPPKIFVSPSASSTLAVRPVTSTTSSSSASVSSRALPFLRDQALRSQHHHDHQQEAEDAEAQLGEVEVQADLAAARC